MTAYIAQVINITTIRGQLLDDTFTLKNILLVLYKLESAHVH